MRMLSRYKSTCWSFQKECRFIFSFKPEKHVKETFFDVMLSMHVFNDIEILLGPCVTEAERLIVEALMGRYLHRMDCKKSVFTGLVNE
jgi:hypothetical protein